MKKILGLVVTLTVLALGVSVFAAGFTAGNIVIYRVGGYTNNATKTGSEILTNTGNSVYLDEYTQAGTWVQSIMMPTNWNGANAPFITDGSGFAQGLISRSEDGRFVVLTGFGATLGQFTNFSIISSFASNEAPRVVALVDGNGNINTTTTLTNILSEEEVRGAASPDGTNLWVGGSVTGIKATTRSSVTSTQVEKTVTNVRAVNIYTNQLYFTASTGIRSTTNFALPTITNALVAILPGTATNNTAPFGFAMFNLNGGPSNDTLYVAEGSVTYGGEGPGAVLKYSLIGTNWVNSGSVGAGSATSVAGFSDGAGVHLFITSGGTATPNANGTLYPFIDTTGFNGNPGGGGDANPNGVIVSPNGLGSDKYNLRGIAMVPQGGESPTNGVGKISVGPCYNGFSSGGAGGPFFPTNFTYYLANFGTTTVNWTAGSNPALPAWLTASPTNGSLAPLASTTVSVTINSAANTMAAGPYVGTVVFHGPIATSISRTISLTISALFISPVTNFTASGPQHGPFTPSSQSYVLSNETGSALTWGVTNVVNWDTLSATNGTLAPNSATSITLTFNANANSLGNGQYFDGLTFLDISHTNPVATAGVTLQVGFGIFDDYSTYNQNANLVGQNGWVAYDNGGQTPYQVANGALQIVFPNTCDSGEEPVKDLSTSTITDITQYVYSGMLITVSNAVVTTSPPFSFGVEDEIKQQEPVTFGAGLGSPVASGSGYVWACRKNVTPPWVIGTTVRAFGTQYLVIDVSDVANSNTWIYVSPADNNVAHLTNMVADAFDGPGTGGAGENSGHGEGAGGFFWGQFGAATCQAGFTISKLAVSTNYADVYNFLAGVTPPPSGDPFTTWQSNYFSVAELGTASFSGPNADPFGKGMSNTNQFLAGFNPTNSAAYLHIISITKTNSGTDIRVDYLGASGDSTYSGGPASRTNVLEFSTGSVGSYNGSNNVNFTSTGQTNILSGGTGLGTLSHMVDPGGATNVPSRYYRVRVLVP